MTDILKNKYLYLILVVFLILCIPGLNTPLAEDEGSWLYPSIQIAETGFKNGTALSIFSPHCYAVINAVFLKLFGISLISCRLTGLISLLSTIILVYFIIHEVIDDNSINKNRFALLGTVLLVSLPVFRQAALIIDIDNTVLIPQTVLFVWCYYKFLESGSIKWGVFTAVSMAFAFWGRLTTPMIIAPIMLFFVFFEKEKLLYKLGISILSFVSGATLFCLTWWIYCSITSVNFTGPFEYTYGMMFYRSVGHGGFSIPWFTLSATCLILWTGIFMSMLLIILAFIRCKEIVLNRFDFKREDIFLGVGAALLIGYTFIGGCIFGFPKHHCPGFPLLVIFTVLTLSKFKQEFSNLNYKLCGAVSLVSIFIYWLITPDLLFFIRFTLRNAKLNGTSISQIVVSPLILLAVSFVLLTSIFVYFAKYNRGARWITALVIISISTNIGYILKQTFADYYIGYNYGGKGTIETADFLDSIIPQNGTAIIPGEVAYHLGRDALTHPDNPVWEDQPLLIEMLNKKENYAIVTSIITNPLSVVNLILKDKEIQKVLNNNYKYQTIGSYYVWIRK